ncbi:ficolin-1-A-like [Saccostrea echinata]|uniref:ficolin-1-A-like n=1 Tax=Saccostrea echinata TaxID=191078 RepID=UPI002A841DBC|nr:ficolin-1-A-like [Saccostrea echinata]
MKDDVKPKPTNHCVTEMNSFRTLLNLASQLVELQQAYCNKRKSVTTGGIQRKGNETVLATEEDIRELKKELKSIMVYTFYPKDWIKCNRESKVYTIYPKKGTRFQVYCDQETERGGWTVIQRRQDGSENFFRTWKDYKIGFGNLSNEFWLGNEKIHTITESGNYKLRIDMGDFSPNSRHAIYRTFKVGNERSGYVLKVSGFSGNGGDSLAYHNNAKFATKDHDNKDNCVKQHKAGWWYTDCHRANLNGLYLKGKHKSYADGVNWYNWKGFYYSLKFTEMKVRKTNN